MHGVDHAGAGRDARLRPAQAARLAHGLVDRRVGGNAVREGELVGAEAQDVAHGRLEGGRAGRAPRR